jgi:uncharacterized membrane protein (DUF4010 family)
VESNPIEAVSPIEALLVSGSLGALIGLVRQWEYETAHPGQDAPAGMRTFMTWALLGCGAGLLQEAGAPWVLAVALGTFTLVMGAVHLVDKKEHHVGLTTFSAAVVTFVAGALAAFGQLQPAVVTGVGTMIILGSKQWLHAWTKRWTAQDLRYFLQFAAITGLILPIAPNQDMGPYQALNPHQIWLMVVLVAGLGFVGYLAMRWLGGRAGIILTGLAGGLVSSTVTTLALSRESRVSRELAGSLALAVVLACTVVMIGREVVIIGLLSPEVMKLTVVPFVLMAVPGGVWAAWQWRSWRGDGEAEVKTPKQDNPLSPWMAVKFGLLYAVITLVVKVAAGQISHTWVYGISFVSGLGDINAITVTSAQAASSHLLDPLVAARCIVLACLANTLAKVGIVVALGGPGFRRAAGVALGVVFVAGAAGLWWL